MTTIKKMLFVLSLTHALTTVFAQKMEVNFDQILNADLAGLKFSDITATRGLSTALPIRMQPQNNLAFDVVSHKKLNLNLHMNNKNTSGMHKRKLYSGLWTYASLNYLYADLVGLMDANVHAQYEAGIVDGTVISPEFLTVAAGFMQIPIANVFLPHFIKNENTLRWVQIVSGSIMTLVQTATLFVGKPTPYYAVFSAFEIAATAYITIDAIKWKTKKSKPQFDASRL